MVKARDKAQSVSGEHGGNGDHRDVGAALTEVRVNHRDARVALAEALKKQLLDTPLSRITVRGLADEAGVTRQAFYYHFDNVNDLTVWVFKNEIADQILSHATYSEWSDGFLSMLLWMRSHPEQSFAVIRSLSLRELQLFLYSQLREMMVAIVDELIGDLRMPDDDRNFVINHFTVSTLGHVNHWLVTEMKQDPRVLVEDVSLILRGQVRASLERFAERARNRGLV